LTLLRLNRYDNFNSKLNGEKLIYWSRASIFFVISLLMALLLPLEQALSAEGEDTYSISLAQTAEIDQEKNREVREIDKNRKALIETYTVKKGDHLWHLFRKRGILEKKNLYELIDVLKRLNPSLQNLDLIYPGQRIVIPLTLTPVGGLPILAPKPSVVTIPVEALKDIDLENYMVKSGDSLIKVVKERFGVSEEEISGQYLGMLRKANPSIENLNRIYPGQLVKLPVFSAQMVRAPIQRKRTPTPQEQERLPIKGSVVAQQLTEIFSLIGEEWATTGEHYIPLKSGGQVNLKADSFPVLNVSNGNRVIVDLYRDLPEKMAQAITSSWDNYKIVQLKKEDDLRQALDRVLAACGYYRIYKQGEPLDLVGDIRIRMTADWIIQPLPSQGEGIGRMILLTLTDSRTAGMSPEIKSFLETLHLKVIEYPSSEPPKPVVLEGVDVLEASQKGPELIEMVLNLTGRSFSKNVEIPVYQGQKTQFSLVVKADFFLYVDGRESIIDHSGLGEETISLLRDQGMQVLSIHSEKDPYLTVSRILEFVGVKFDSNPHPFMASSRGESRNVKMTIPGIVFQDNHGQNIFASHLRLPDEIVGFLYKKGYKILNLGLS